MRERYSDNAESRRSVTPPNRPKWSITGMRRLTWFRGGKTIGPGGVGYLAAERNAIGKIVIHRSRIDCETRWVTGDVSTRVAHHHSVHSGLVGPHVVQLQGRISCPGQICAVP